MITNLLIKQVKPFSSFVKDLVPDPRKYGGRKYEVYEMIDLILIGLIAGQTDLVAISNYIRENFEEFNSFLNLAGPPSHDALNDIINRIDPERLKIAFEEWVSSIRITEGVFILSGDGTFCNASTDKKHKGKEPNIVNFYSPATNLVTSIELTMGKGGRETEAFKRILERIELRRSIITADALNCTYWIMDYIDEQGGYYFFPVKKDKRRLLKSIVDALLIDLKRTKQHHQNFKEDHGVLVDRYIYLSSDLSRLRLHWHYPSVKQYGIIESTRMHYHYDKEGKRVIDKVEFKYYGVISNFRCKAEEAGRVKLKEWSVESFHRIKDDFFKEDHTTYRSEKGIMNMAILRRVAFNYLSLSNDLISGLNCSTIREKSIFLDANKDLLTIMVTGYNPDYPNLMEDYHKNKAQYYKELGLLFNGESSPSPEFYSRVDYLEI